MSRFPRCLSSVSISFRSSLLGMLLVCIMSPALPHLVTAETIIATGTMNAGQSFSLRWTLPDDSPRTQLTVSGNDVFADYGPTPEWRLEASIEGFFDVVLTPENALTSGARISILDRSVGEDGFTAEWSANGQPLFPVTNAFGDGNVLSLAVVTASFDGTLTAFDLPHVFDNLSLEQFRFAAFEFNASFDNGAIAVTDYGVLDSFSVIPEPSTTLLMMVSLSVVAVLGRVRDLAVIPREAPRTREGLLGNGVR